MLKLKKQRFVWVVEGLKDNVNSKFWELKNLLQERFAGYVYTVSHGYYYDDDGSYELRLETSVDLNESQIEEILKLIDSIINV